MCFLHLQGLYTNIISLLGLSRWDNVCPPVLPNENKQMCACLIPLILVVGRKLKTQECKSMPSLISSIVVRAGSPGYARRS